MFSNLCQRLLRCVWHDRLQQDGTAFGLIFLATVVLMTGGCSKEKLDELVASAKETTESVKSQVTDAAAGVSDQADRTMDAVGSVLPSSGSITLQLDKPVECERANLQVIRVDDKRPVVVQVTSYRTDRAIDSYPSVLLRALTTPTDSEFADVGPWLDKPLACRVFVQLEENGPIWSNELNSPVELTLRRDSSGGDMVQGSLASGTLVASDGAQVTMSAGSLSASIVPAIGGTL
jgi:hypothetical protein